MQYRTKRVWFNKQFLLALLGRDEAASFVWVHAKRQVFEYNFHLQEYKWCKEMISLYCYFPIIQENFYYSEMLCKDMGDIILIDKLKGRLNQMD